MSINNYKLELILGRGISGCVYKATNVVDGEKVVIKVFPLRKKIAYNTEVRTLKYLREHSEDYFFPEYLDSFTITKEKRVKYLLITDYISWEGLFEYSLTIINAEEKIKSKICINIIKAVKKLHNIGIIHRDIKPENILINIQTLEIKLIDFDIAIISEENIYPDVEIIRGSMGFIAPELFHINNKDLEDRDLCDFFKKTDIYSVGATIYEILTGQRLYKDALDNKYNITAYNENILSPKWHIVISSMLDDMHNRYNIDQVCDLL